MVQTDSPRGEILDRNGKVLAQDVAALGRHGRPRADEAKAPATRCSGQLVEVLGIPQPACRADYDSPRQSPILPAIVDLDVPLDKRLALLEHQDDYPGVHVVELTVRKLPRRSSRPQVLGYVGEIGGSSSSS